MGFRIFAFTLLFCLSWLYGSNVSGKEGTDSRITGLPIPELNEGVSLLTWNLQWFPGNSRTTTADAEEAQIKEVAAQLNETGAEIVCLQEVKGAGAVERLLELLPGYRMQFVSDFSGALEIAIISRVDAVSAFAEEFEEAEITPPRGFVYAAYDFDGHLLLVYSVHFKSNVGGIPASIPKREESARQLLSHVEDAKRIHLTDGAKSVSVVLAGDFNTSLIAENFVEDKTGAIILDSGFQWGFRGMVGEDLVTWLSDGRYPDVDFDHFFIRASEGTIFGRSYVLPTERFVSDHRPVVMWLKMPEH
ncbi:MAG: endonuclease/exonuclease/phosphatase family protein [Verrucomicrobiota bacterium]